MENETHTKNNRKNSKTHTHKTIIHFARINGVPASSATFASINCSNSGKIGVVIITPSKWHSPVTRVWLPFWRCLALASILPLSTIRRWKTLFCGKWKNERAASGINVRQTRAHEVNHLASSTLQFTTPGDSERMLWRHPAVGHCQTHNANNGNDLLSQQWTTTEGGET